MANSSEGFYVGFEDIGVLIKGNVFRRNLEFALHKWFHMRLQDFPRVLNCMALERGTYEVTQKAMSNSTLEMKIFSWTGKEYTLEIRRGDMVNPYPTWELTYDDKSRKVFNVEATINVTEICAYDTEGNMKTLED